jgi:hypothetical protein
MSVLAAMPFVLADIDPGLIVVVIAVAISFISWIINAIGKQKNQPPPPPARGARPVRPRDEKLTNEIDLFLQEVAEGKRPTTERRPAEPTLEELQRAEAKRRAEFRQRAEQRRAELQRKSERMRRPAEVEIEVVAEPERRPPLRTPRPSRETGRPAEAAVVLEPPKSVFPHAEQHRLPGSNIGERKSITDPTLGSGVSAHLSDYMQPARIDQQVDRNLPHSINASVQQHLGMFGAGLVESGAKRTEAAQAIVDMLRNRAGVRQAILLNEVLSPPKSLRR